MADGRWQMADGRAQSERGWGWMTGNGKASTRPSGSIPQRATRRCRLRSLSVRLADKCSAAAVPSVPMAMCSRRVGVCPANERDVNTSRATRECESGRPRSTPPLVRRRSRREALPRSVGKPTSVWGTSGGRSAGRFHLRSLCCTLGRRQQPMQHNHPWACPGKKETLLDLPRPGQTRDAS
jgi:hypothetical protein